MSVNYLRHSFYEKRGQGGQWFFYGKEVVAQSGGFRSGFLKWSHHIVLRLFQNSSGNVEYILALFKNKNCSKLKKEKNKQTKNWSTKLLKPILFHTNSEDQKNIQNLPIFILPGPICRSVYKIFKTLEKTFLSLVLEESTWKSDVKHLVLTHGRKQLWHCTKMKFSIKDFFSKCDQIRSFLPLWSNLLKKFLMENFILCAASWLSERCS